MKKQMKENLKIILKYSGKEVDDGTMSIDDFLPVLQGFASAYGKIATNKNLDYEHNLRIIGIEKGSIDILLQVWQTLGQNANQIQSIPVIGSGVKYIVKTIMKIIALIKHVKKQPYETKINPTNQTIIVTNIDKVNLEVPLEIFNLFKEGFISSDLNKMVKPLEEGRIDKTELVVKFDDTEEKEVIIFEEKKFFDTLNLPIATTKETWLTGKFNSLTKSTNRGYFFLSDGTRVSYELKAENPEVLYPFFIYKGPVRVKCIVNLDENLKPTSIDIYDIQKLQTDIYEKEKT